MGIFPYKEGKIVSLSEAVSLVKDGNIVGVGGNLSAREPMGIIREIIRQGRKNLHTIGGAHGVDIDLLCAGGAVGTVQNSFVGFEADFGLAPNYRRAAESGAIHIKETDCIAVMMQLRASVFGIPFMPTPAVRGTDVLKFHPEVRQIECPFSGQQINLLPAVRPDVAIIHAHKADEEGNIKLHPPYFADLLLVEASDKVIVTVEEIISREEMREIGSNIPYYEVTAVVELPFGAHPTSCYPDYTYDRSHLAEYVKAAQAGPDAFRSRYLDRYVFGVKDHEEYLELIGGEEKLKALKSWRESRRRWQELLSAE